MNEQARRSTPPNRVRSPTDQQFASGCSPPRLTATQLPLATELWHPPTRTFTVLMWRITGALIPAEAEIQTSLELDLNKGILNDVLKIIDIMI